MLTNTNPCVTSSGSSPAPTPGDKVIVYDNKGKIIGIGTILYSSNEEETGGDEPVVIEYKDVEN